MTSNFDCLGLGLPDRDAFSRLLDQVIPASEVLAEVGGLTLRRWTDPSGARLVLGLRGPSLDVLIPGFAGTPGARLGGVRRVNDEMIVADVLDEAGEQVTMLAAAAEQLPLMSTGGATADGRGAVSGLGVEVSVHESEEAFHASPASLLSGDDPDGIRTGGESFISYGVFNQAEGEPYALLNGVVLAAGRRRTQITGGEFSVARVRTAGFEADICLPAGLPTPVPGNVVAGTVYLVADLPFVSAPRSVPAGKKRSWWRR